MRYFVTTLSLMLASCGITPIHYDGKTATYQHLELDFGVAMNQAKEMCAKDGKGIKHERSDCRGKCVSTFTCVEK
jgi:hypothetical protein